MNQVNVLIKSQFLKKPIFFLLISFVFSGCAPYEIHRPENWSKTVELTKKPMLSSVIASDAESEVVLFSYDEVPHAQPILVKKIVKDHWIVVLEKTTKTPSPDVKVEQLNESEFRLSLNRNSK
jgi:hypothetical protein